MGERRRVPFRRVTREPAELEGDAPRSGNELTQGSEGARRIHEIDAVRGFALCGIVFVNIVGITGMPARRTPGDHDLALYAFEVILHHRFFPFFAFLFGLSFAIFLQAARSRSTHPRSVMLARLGFLIIFGVLHRLLQPDEVLLPYAIVGIVVLIPASFLPRYPILAIGCVATIGSLALTEGGNSLIPGLFLLGMATALYDVPNNLKSHTRRMGLLFGASSLLAIALSIFQVQSGMAPSSHLPAIAGLATATAYTSGLLLLLHSRAQKPVSLLEPFGRMALTNYIAATPIIIGANQYLHLEDASRYGVVTGLGFGILIFQITYSWFWLRRFKYGPLEWIWRCLTWWQLIPNRVPSANRTR